MKKFLVITFISTVFLLTSLINVANEGCLDNKNRSRKEGPNYQAYRSVVCMCNCEQYPWSPDRCRCENCKHYHDPITNFTIKRKWEKQPMVKSIFDIS